MALQIRRGTEANRTTITPAAGEPIFTTDGKKVFIGDGTTAGGVAVTKALTIDTQDFTASGTWTKPANAIWVEVTMCGAGEAGSNGSTVAAGVGGRGGRVAAKTFAAADLGSTVSVTCGTEMANQTYNASSTSSFGSHLYALGAAAAGGGSTLETSGLSNILENDVGTALSQYFGAGGFAGENGGVGNSFGPGGGGAGATSGTGFSGGKASSGQGSTAYYEVARGGGAAGGAAGSTGSNGSNGYDTITGFGHGAGGGGEGTSGAGGNGGAAVRGGGGGGGGLGTTAGGTGGAGGAGFVRVRTLCFG